MQAAVGHALCQSSLDKVQSLSYLLTALALALVHRLAIGNNLPFGKIGAFFVRICNSLIIEFVPKSDSQVQRLLSTREDIFPEYTPGAFENTFGRYFTVQTSAKIKDTDRILYLMRERQTRP